MKQNLFSCNNNQIQFSEQNLGIHSQEGREIFRYFFDQYKNIQDQLHLKFPCSNNLKVAKIEKIINDQQGLSIQYFYEGFEGEKQDIPIIFEDSYVDEGFKLASSFQSSQLDASNFTRVLFNLIEIFYQSANFGLFFDSYDENLYYYKELDQFVFLPTFSLIVRYLQSPTEQSIKRKFLEFRRKIYQNATYHFLNSFYKQFLNQTKLSEEDSQFFQDNFNQVGNFSINDILNIEESWKGVDYLYREEKFLKRLPRYKFKQSMILYQLQNNQNLQDLFKKSCENETKILEQKSNDSNSMQSTILAQFNNIQSFFREIPIGNESSSFEIFGNFMTIMHDYLKSQNISENKIDLAPYSQLGLIRQTIEFKDQQKNENIFEFTLCNEIEKQKSSNQQQKQYNQYDLKIQYIFQCTQSSIIIKTTINEIQLSIDTADDLIFLINTIIREPSAINIYVDASRKLTLQTSVTMASPLKLFRIAIRIFDILQIYYIMILGFYQQNIQLGRSLKEKQFQQFVKELIHYMSDYEIDFDDQMKKFGLDNENQSGQIK